MFVYHKSAVALAFFLIGIAGCDLLSSEAGEDLLFMVEKPQYEIGLVLDSTYRTAESISILFTNTTDSTLYLTNDGDPYEWIERFVDGKWLNAIVVFRVADLAEPVPIEPGRSHRFEKLIFFDLDERHLPLDGPPPEIEDVYGRYRMRFEVLTHQGPPAISLARDRTVSNSFELVAPE